MHFTSTLTTRETDALTWVAAGKSDAEIAGIMDLSRKTINFHIENAKRKLGYTSRVTAIAAALRDGLIPFPGHHPEPCASPFPSPFPAPFQTPSLDAAPAPFQPHIAAPAACA